MKHILNLILILLLSLIFKGNIQSQEALFAPNLISPEHKTGYTTIPSEFIWNKVDNAKSYLLQITTDVTFLNMDTTSSIIANLNDTIYTKLSKILIDTMYFWRVKAINDTTESNWSFIRMFITGYTSISDDSKAIQITPIPIKDYAKITLDNDYDDLKCFIFTTSGVLVEAKTFSITNNIIDFTKCFRGSYFIIITSKNKIIGSKSIIVK